MSLAIIVGTIAILSIGGSAYLLWIWHEDARSMKVGGGAVSAWRTWPFSRVLAYVAIGAMLSSNYLFVSTILRLLDVPNYREIQLALTPLTLAALLFLDMAFLIIALYLRVIRGRGERVP